jgi:hypothetical protein
MGILSKLAKLVGTSRKGVAPLAGGRGAPVGSRDSFQAWKTRMFPGSSGIDKPGFKDRVAAGFSEAGERFAGTRTGQVLQKLGVRPVQRASARAADPLQTFSRGDAVGIIPRTISYAGYAAPGAAFTYGGGRAYRSWRDRTLPEISNIPGAPSLSGSSISPRDAYLESIMNPQMQALEEWVNGGWQDEERARLEDIIAQQQMFNEGIAQGFERGYGEYGSEQQAIVDAINQMTQLSEEAGTAQRAEDVAAVEAALASGEFDPLMSSLTPLPGYMADIPDEFGEQSELTAREALDNLIAQSAAPGFEAASADRWGRMMSDQSRADAARDMFMFRTQREAQLGAELERRREMALMQQLGMQEQLGQFDVIDALESQEIEKQVDAAVRALVNSPSRYEQVKRDWQALTDPRFLQNAPWARRRNQQELALLQAQGVTNFDEYVRFRARIESGL